MLLKGEQLPAHLERELRPLYVLYGDEPLLVLEAADAIRAAARTQGYTERTVHTVAGAHFDCSEVLAAGGSLSLFADKQIVEVRIPTGKPGKEGSTALQQLAESAQSSATKAIGGIARKPTSDLRVPSLSLRALCGVRAVTRSDSSLTAHPLQRHEAEAAPFDGHSTFVDEF